MRTIRKGTFETNSSSMHSLVLSNDWTVEERKNATLHAVFKDFSDRQLVLRTEPEDKFAYVWMVFCGGIKFPNSQNKEIKLENERYYNSHWPRKDLVDGKLSEEEIKERDKFYREKLDNAPTQYSDAEKEEIEKRFNRLVEYLSDLAKQFEDDDYQPLHLDFDDLDYEVHEYGYVSLESKSEDFADTGCYGNAGIAAYFDMSRAWEEINNFLDTGVKSEKDWYVHSCFDNMIDFAFSPKTILIQNTDECDEEDEEKHYKTVMEYFIKNEGRATVIHPIGG